MEKERTTVFIPVLLATGVVTLVIVTAAYFADILERKCGDQTETYKTETVCHLAD